MKPEISIPVALATGAMVYGIYLNALPPLVDIRTAPPNHPDVASAEKAAAWTSAAVVAGVSLIAKDATVFIFGGAVIIGLSWLHSHANMVNPEFGAAVPKAGGKPEQLPGDDEMSSAEGYNEEYAE